MTHRHSVAENVRHPLITPHGQRLLTWLREHPQAPRYNFACGDRMSRAGIERVRTFEDTLMAGFPRQEAGRLPLWMIAHMRRCLENVPLHRRRATESARKWMAGGGRSEDAWEVFSGLETSDRRDLQREPWSLVPDDQALDDMIVYETSGTTGTAVLVMSHPDVSTSYLALLRRALALEGVTLDGGDRVSIVHVGAQEATLTHCSISSYLGDAGFAKVNLSLAEWRDPSHRATFLDACHPEIYTGDPLAFEELATLDLATRPKALVSSAMALSPALARRLEHHFGCPVIDAWSLNECRLVTVASDAGHALIRPDVYVEVVDEAGRPCRDGVRGEIALSGGNNPFLALMRYRTGDFASLARPGGQPVLVGLEGRAPIRFLGTGGRMFNNIDVTHALRDLPLATLSLHQDADGSLRCRFHGAVVPGDVEGVLRGLFGQDTPLRVEAAQAGPFRGKLIRYTSNLVTATPPASGGTNKEEGP